jgi:hypothetical protein
MQGALLVLAAVLAGCSFDLTRSSADRATGPTPDRPTPLDARRDGPGLDVPADAPGSDRPPGDSAKPADAGKPGDAKKPGEVKKGDATKQADAKVGDSKKPDAPKPDLPRDLAKPDKPQPDVSGCAGVSGQCYHPTLGCRPGWIDSTCGTNGAHCVDCSAKQMVCENDVCVCKGCTNGATCVGIGWTNDPNCGINGNPCVNCTSIGKTCNAATGLCNPP